MFRRCLLCLVFVSLSGALFCAHAQQLQISPSSLTFKNQLLNTASDSQPVTLTNTGDASVTVSAIHPSGNYSSTSQCAVLLPAESCTIDIAFTPTSLGTTDGAVTIRSDAQSMPQTITLSGAAIPPLKLSPATLSFGSVPVGTITGSQAITLTNLQTVDAPITIASSGDYPESSNCPATLAASKSCVIHVAFHPTSAAFVAGALSVTAGIVSAAPVGLSGTGTGNVVSNVSLSSTNLAFGDDTVGTFAPTQRVTLTNTSSTTSLSIQSVTISGPGAYTQQFARPPCTGMLAPGGQCVIVVLFGPAADFAPVDYPGAVTIADSDVTSPQVIQLSGRGTDEVTFSPTGLHFPEQKVGTFSAPQIVTVTSTIQHGEALILGIADTGDFTAVGAGPTPCVGALMILTGSCTIAVSFRPTHTGVITGSVAFSMYPTCEIGFCAKPSVLNVIGKGK